MRCPACLVDLNETAVRCPLCGGATENTPPVLGSIPYQPYPVCRPERPHRKPKGAPPSGASRLTPRERLRAFFHF